MLIARAAYNKGKITGRLITDTIIVVIGQGFRHERFHSEVGKNVIAQNHDAFPLLSLSGLQGIQPRQMAKRIAHPAREPMKTAAPESQETSQVKILQNMEKPLLKV